MGWKTQNYRSWNQISGFQELGDGVKIDYKGAQRTFGVMEVFCISIAVVVTRLYSISKTHQSPKPILRKDESTICNSFLNKPDFQMAQRKMTSYVYVGIYTHTNMPLTCIRMHVYICVYICMCVYIYIYNYIYSSTEWDWRGKNDKSDIHTNIYV